MPTRRLSPQQWPQPRSTWRATIKRRTAIAKGKWESYIIFYTHRTDSPTSKILQICRILLWRPYALTKHFKKQGIVGPPYSFLYGSLHEAIKEAESSCNPNCLGCKLTWYHSDCCPSLPQVVLVIWCLISLPFSTSLYIYIYIYMILALLELLFIIMLRYLLVCLQKKKKKEKKKEKRY